MEKIIFILILGMFCLLEKGGRWDTLYMKTDFDFAQGLDMEKLAASLGSKMTGSSPEMLNKIPGMEVLDVIINTSANIVSIIIINFN